MAASPNDPVSELLKPHPGARHSTSGRDSLVPRPGMYILTTPTLWISPRFRSVPNLKLCIIRKTYRCLEFSAREELYVREVCPEIAGDEDREAV